MSSIDSPIPADIFSDIQLLLRSSDGEKITNTSQEGTGFSGIIEVTYAYDTLPHEPDEPETFLGRNFNRTLFGEFAGLGHETTPDVLWHTTEAKLQNIARRLKRHREMLTTFPRNDPSLSILRGTVSYLCDLVALALAGLPFEIEKAGYAITDFSDNPDAVHDRIKDVEMIERRLWGTIVRESEEERSGCARLIRQVIETIPDNEDRIFLQKVATTFFPDIDTSATPSVLAPSTPDTRHFEFSVTIPLPQAAEILTLAYRFYGITDMRATIREGRSTATDHDGGVDLPAHLPSLTFSRLLVLVAHEVETHGLTTTNTRLLLERLRGGDNLPREEATASYMGDSILGYHHSDTGSSVVCDNLPEILAGSLLSDADFTKFIRWWCIHRYDYTTPATWRARYLRLRRNYPAGEFPVREADGSWRVIRRHMPCGSQHKDTTYYRGRKDMTAYIHDGGDVRDLWLAKVSFSDIPHVRALYENLPDETRRLLVFPKFLGEHLLVRFTLPYLDHARFVAYLLGRSPLFASYINTLPPLNTHETEILERIIEILQGIGIRTP